MSDSNYNTPNNANNDNVDGIGNMGVYNSNKIKDFCVSCLVDLKDISKERYETDGNYCRICSIGSSQKNKKTKQREYFDK